MPTRQEIIDYITQSALRRGIDPNVAIKVWTHEGKGATDYQSGVYNAKGLREPSYGPFQLLLGGKGTGFSPGLGNRAPFNVRDPNTWRENIDFALDEAKRDGWRQWYGAANAGIGRWTGVNGRPDTSRLADIKNVDLGSEPTLQNLSPPTKPTRNVAREDSAERQIISQMSPTEASSDMARSRYPDRNDAINQALNEYIQLAGFVPPGLTKGAAKTRAGANANVVPRGGLPIERDIGADVGPYNRNAPGTRGMEGSYADYVRKQHEEMAKARGGDTQLPPGVKSATDPAGAVDPRTGTALERTDPNLAAQNDPAGQALIAQKIVGRAVPGSGGPVPRTSTTTPGGRAATAAAATALGVASTDTDPAVQAVKDKIASSGAAAPVTRSQAANVDPGVDIVEKQLGMKPGTLRDPNTGVQSMAAGPMIGQALPVFKEVMKDPQGRQAVQTAVKTAITKKAQIDAQQADMKNDPTYYQQLAARGQMPGGQQDDRAMERAVMMDNQRALARRMGSQPPQQQQPVAPRPPQPVPPPQTTRGTVGVRSTPPEIRNSTEEQILNQVIPPGAEKGDVPPTNAVARMPPQPPTPQVRNMTAAQAYPYGMTPPPGAYDPSGGIPQGVPSSGQMPMDPTMMQLMQFFTQGGGGGNVG